jgi:hypothetical protein
LRTIVQAAHAVGVDPWMIFKRFDRLWERLLQGESSEVTKIGPKDLIIDIRGGQLPRFEYFRVAFCGVVTAAMKLGGAKSVQVICHSWSSSGDQLKMRGSCV